MKARNPRIRRQEQYRNPMQDLIDAVLLETFQHEQERLKNDFEQLVIENQTRGGTMNGFRYEGLLYAVIPLNKFRQENIANLAEDLVPAFQRYMESKNRLEKDIQRIRNSLSVVLNKCRHPQDVRDVLPEVIVCKVDKFRGMDRIREEGWVLRDFPHLKAQFESAIELLCFYQANRLIYG